MSGRYAPAPFMPVTYKLPVPSVVTYRLGSTGLRINKVVSSNKLKPVLLMPPSVLRAKARVSTLGGATRTGGKGGIAVTIGGRVTIRATVGCGVGVSAMPSGVVSAGIGVKIPWSVLGASAVIKVGVTSSVAGGSVGACCGSTGAVVTVAPTGSKAKVAIKVSSSADRVRVGVGVGGRTRVGVFVSVGSGVKVGGIVIDGVNVGVKVDVAVSVGRIGIGVTVGIGVLVALGKGDKVGAGVLLGVGLG